MTSRERGRRWTAKQAAQFFMNIEDDDSSSFSDDQEDDDIEVYINIKLPPKNANK